VLTAHERLTAPGVVFHLPRCCALAREAAVRLAYGHGPREVLLKLRSWSPLQPRPASAQLDSSNSPIQHPQRPSGAD
jgi:hypothetical protein